MRSNVRVHATLLGVKLLTGLPMMAVMILMTKMMIVNTLLHEGGDDTYNSEGDAIII